MSDSNVDVGLFMIYGHLVLVEKIQTHQAFCQVRTEWINFHAILDGQPVALQQENACCLEIW